MSNYLIYICQDLYYLSNILARNNILLASDFSHLANTLANIDNMLKANFYHLASILINTDDKTDNFIKKKLIVFNQLLIFCY